MEQKIKKYNRLSVISFVLIIISYIIGLLIGGIYGFLAAIINFIGLVIAIGSNFVIDESKEKGKKLITMTILLSIILFLILLFMLSSVTPIQDSW